jgi:hypothetical protein
VPWLGEEVTLEGAEAVHDVMPQQPPSCSVAWMNSTSSKFLPRLLDPFYEDIKYAGAPPDTRVHRDPEHRPAADSVVKVVEAEQRSQGRGRAGRLRRRPAAA